MSATQQVNFRADIEFYKEAKKEITQEGLSVSDVLNATLRKIVTGAINPRNFVMSDDVADESLKVAFTDLKREILAGHKAILAGKTTELADVRKEFNLD